MSDQSKECPDIKKCSYPHCSCMPMQFGKSPIDNPEVKAAIFDRLFLQEIINDLYRHGFRRGGKAEQMLKDWSAEMREKTHLRGKTKKQFFELVGKELW